jgi:hypothetical protein
MSRKALFVGLILLAVSLVAMAADVTGKWTFEQVGRGGGGGGGGTPRVVTLDLKSSGSTLTGTILQPMGGRGGGGGGAAPAAPTPVEIKNGKINGDNISFDVVRETQNGAQTTKYEGTVSGSELKLKITRTGQDGTPQTSEVTAKKSTT